jgi:hypothetical protein
MPRAKGAKKTNSGPSALIGNTRVLSNIMRLFANYVQDGNIQFGEDGIHISGMDQSHVCLVRCNLTSDSMTYTPPQSPMSIGLSFSVMSKILSACSNATCTTLKPDHTTQKLGVFVMTDKGENQFNVSQMEIDEDEMGVPDMDYEITRTIDTSAIKEATDQADKLGADSLTLTRTHTNELRMTYTSDLVEGNVLVDCGEETGTRKNEVTIATTYLKGFLGSGPFGPKTIVCYDGSSAPLRVKCPLVNMSGDLSEHDYVEIHIAPRSNDDYDDDEEEAENVREY